jgi:hypothetical protein
MAKNNPTETSMMREQLNVVIALLLILTGKEGRKELLKKRRATGDVVAYLQKIGLSNKDLAGIFNTGENSISNLKAKKKKVAKGTKGKTNKRKK